MMLKKGDRAPNFILPNANGEDFALDDYRGKWILLFFYPRNGTSICTKEACAFRDDFAEFRRRGIEMVGINFQRPEAHKRFTEKHNLPFPLLWDRQKRICKRYGVLGAFGLYCKRAYFLVDPKGWVAYAHIEKSAFLKRSNEDLLAEIDSCREKSE